MMGAAMIRAIADDATARAKRERKQPFVCPTTWGRMDGRHRASHAEATGVPFVGDYVPRGWKRSERELLFVDTSGFGRDDEPALSRKQFFDAMVPGRGYAVAEAGQFQAYVAEFVRVDDDIG